MDNMDIVRLSVPGTLAHRDLVLRVVASVCRLVRRTADLTQELGHRERVEDFDEKVVSAVGEAFNNVAIHAYRNVRGAAEIELEFEGDSLTIRLLDRGDGFEIFKEIGQNLETLRESNMGLEIMLACMDHVSYTRGGPTAPNVLTMTKSYFTKAVGSTRAG
jgi:serine/threonine-protein kinase RsbW